MSGAVAARVVPSSATSDAAGDGQELGPVAGLMTWALVLVLVWLPIQTPLAIAVFQYGHSVSLSQAVLLLKDAAVAALLLGVLTATWRSLRLRWFDKVAIAYVVVVAVYSVVPLLRSSQTFTTVVSSAREFAMPVEAYALGRLAVLAGADVKFVFKAFVAASALVAAAALFEYYLLPITFWSSTLDLVTFERVVQGIPSADSLWGISLLGDYGTGHGAYARAIATFTHPVGAGGYFILPFGLTVAAWYGREADGRRLMAAGLIGLTLLFGLATIATLSRGAWIAAAVVVVICGIMFSRLRIALLCLVVAGTFLVSVPPFSDSISSALNRNDSSMIGHMEAIGRDVQAAVGNVFGLGLGSADRAVAKTPVTKAPPKQGGGGVESDASIGENLYLSVFVSTGPLGAAAFIAWCLGVVVLLLRAARRSATPWLVAGMAAATAGSLVSAMSASALMRFTTAASSWLLLGLATGLVLAASPEAGGLRFRLPGWLARRRAKGSDPDSGVAATPPVDSYPQPGI